MCACLYGFFLPSFGLGLVLLGLWWLGTDVRHTHTHGYSRTPVFSPPAKCKWLNFPKSTTRGHKQGNTWRGSLLWDKLSEARVLYHVRVFRNWARSTTTQPQLPLFSLFLTAAICSSFPFLVPNKRLLSPSSDTLSTFNLSYPSHLT